jgi:transcription antitermination factor NusG
MNRWMVGWTRPNAEFDVVAKLREMNFDAFVPAIRKSRVVNRWVRNHAPRREHREIVLIPAFPRYMLFSANEAQPVWQRALRGDPQRAGMTLVVRKAGDRVEPGILPQIIVDRLLGPDGDGVILDLAKTVEAIKRFAKGASIQITSGPFEGFPGVVVGHEGRNVRVLLSIFGGQQATAISPESIRAA